jgi:plastocyanin
MKAVALVGIAWIGVAAVPGSTAAQGVLKVDPATAGAITGRVTFEGARPAREPLDMSANHYCVQVAGAQVRSDAILIDRDGGLQNVFVYLKSGLDPSYAFDGQAAPAVLDQRSCQFVPRVVGVQVGQPLEIRNSDQTLHNVHGRPKANQQFNNGQPIAGMRMTKTFTRPEVMIPLTSDVHSWMAAFVGVLPHPFFAVTGPDGAFRIDGVPPGGYVVEAWHEQFGTATEPITVDPGQTTSVSFTFRRRGQP